MKARVVLFKGRKNKDGTYPLKLKLSDGSEKKYISMGISLSENEWSKLKLSTRPENTGMRKICTDLGFIQEAYLTKEYLNRDLIQYGFFPEE